MGNYASKTDLKAKSDSVQSDINTVKDGLSSWKLAKGVQVGTNDMQFDKNVTVAGTFTANGDTVLKGAVKVPSTSLMQFGSDVAIGAEDGTREQSAGQIGYNIHGGTADRPHLAVVGAGKSGQNRKVRLFDELQVIGSLSLGADGVDGKYHLVPGPDGKELKLLDKAGNSGPGFAAQSLWTKKITADADSRVKFPSGMKVGDWSIYPNGEQLCFRTAKGDVMCIHHGDNKFEIYQNSNHDAPFLLYRKSDGFFGYYFRK